MMKTIKTNNRKSGSLKVLASLLISATFALGADYNPIEGSQLFQLGANPSAIALSGSFAAMNEDHSLVLQNPVVAAKISRHTVSFSTLGFGDLFGWSGAYSLPTDYGVFTLGAQSFNSEKMELKSYLDASLGFAKEISTVYRFGGALHVDRALDYKDNQSIGVYVDGVITAVNRKKLNNTLGVGGLTYAVMVKNLGVPSTAGDFVDSNNKPATMKALHLRGGVGFDFLALKLDKVKVPTFLKSRFMADLAFDTLPYFTFRFHTALDNRFYIPVDIIDSLSLKIGYHLGEGVYGVPGTGPVTAGLGANFKVANTDISLQYSVLPNKLIDPKKLDLNHLIGVSVSFGFKDESKPEIDLKVFED